MTRLKWDQEMSRWRGVCPRCGMGGFYEVQKTNAYGGYSIDVLICSNRHHFCIEYERSDRNALSSIFPIEFVGDVPEWLPEEYRDAYTEMLKDYNDQRYRGAIAVAGIIMDADVNTLLNTKGDKGKSLFLRLQILIEKGKIDRDEFSEATVARIGRKEAIHPEDIKDAPAEENAQEIIESVKNYLERRYKYRASRALPEPEKKDDAETEEQEVKSA